MLTAKDVETLLKANDEYFHWNKFEWDDGPSDITITLPVEVVDTKFGGEGDWQTETYIVIKVGDQYFRKTGWYASHDGQYWDGALEEVTPKEKVITSWESK